MLFYIAACYSVLSTELHVCLFLDLIEFVEA